MNSSPLMHAATSRQWERIGIKQHHGLIIPLFSLHSDHSCGIGEFLDLIPIIDWCQSIGLDVIQLLPLNDSGLDSSPYSAISAYALNPIHLSLFKLPHLDEYPALLEQLSFIQTKEAGPKVIYPKVRLAKEEFLRNYYQLTKASIVSHQSYQHFVKVNASWLNDYALFKVLKVQQGWIHWEHWPEELQNPSLQDKEELLRLFHEDIEFHFVLQFLCDQQLSTVKDHASQHNVLIMGDIPILISRDSADVWSNRSIFNLNCSAGAPPDMFTSEGQEWGFPTYNWEVLEKQEYHWWKLRLHLASHYYHLYRIDHIVGFFRIWTIPIGKKGKDGYFVPGDRSIWIEHGRKILHMMVASSSMLPIGEDLGDVAPDVKSCLIELGICGMKVMRWEKDWDGTKQFLPIDTYPSISLTTVSTHDSETLALWWVNQKEEARDFAISKGWEYHPFLSNDYRYKILWDSHHSNSLFHINLLQEYLALIPDMTWPNLEDERINTPGIYSDSNWSYRFRPSVEELISNTNLFRLLKELIV